MKILTRAETRIGLWLVVLTAVAAFVWDRPNGMRQDVFGQEAAEESADEEVTAEEAVDNETTFSLDLGNIGYESLGKMVLSSGVLGWVFYFVLAIFSIVGMAVTLERLCRLRHGRIIPRKFASGLKRLVRENRDTTEEFRTLCDASRSPISRILRAGLLRAGRSLPEVEKSMEDAAAREMAELRSRNKPLSVVGSVAPLVGLLGTVVGMILAFRISSQAGLGKAELLAEGIYLALMTTAAGLTIAIPCLLLFAWFNGKAERFMREIDEVLAETFACFARLENHEVGRNQAHVPSPSTKAPPESVATAIGTRS